LVVLRGTTTKKYAVVSISSIAVEVFGSDLRHAVKAHTRISDQWNRRRHMWRVAPVIVQQLIEVLTEIRAEGVTVLLVEQDVHTALSVADRGYVMEMGSIVHSGPADALISDPSVRQAYLGM
jgi:ABC-type antimicrobial peptide transport system ATPase subunit